MIDPYLDPVTGVLKNRLGLTDDDALQEAETRYSMARDAQLAQEPIPGDFDLEHLQRVHGTLFGDVYTWAGKLRTIGITRSGMPFCAPQFIEQVAHGELEDLIEDFRQGPDGGDLGPVAGNLAHILGELNAIHPFREGNGRSQRALLRHLAATKGWTIDWSGMNAEQNIAASREAMLLNYEPFAELLAPILGVI